MGLVRASDDSCNNASGSCLIGRDSHFSCPWSHTTGMQSKVHLTYRTNLPRCELAGLTTKPSFEALLHGVVAIEYPVGVGSRVVGRLWPVT